MYRVVRLGGVAYVCEGKASVALRHLPFVPVGCLQPVADTERRTLFCDVGCFYAEAEVFALPALCIGLDAQEAEHSK